MAVLSTVFFGLKLLIVILMPCFNLFDSFFVCSYNRIDFFVCLVYICVFLRAFCVLDLCIYSVLWREAEKERNYYSFGTQSVLSVCFIHISVFGFSRWRRVVAPRRIHIYRKKQVLLVFHAYNKV